MYISNNKQNVFDINARELLCPMPRDFIFKLTCENAGFIYNFSHRIVTS